MVNKIIERPTLEIPTFSIKIYMPFIIQPSNFAIGPRMAPLYAVNNISDTENTSNYGTGSYPPFEKGLHLNILHIASPNPFIGPYFNIACLEYSEQVGVKRHEGGV